MNRVIIMGRLTADPELKTTASGVSVAAFRVAVDRDHQPKGGDRQADFIPCVAWRQTAEFVSHYFQKGRMIALEGSLQSRNYEDKQGQKRTAYEVIADRIWFCGEKKLDGSAAMNDIVGKAAAAGVEIDAGGWDPPW